MTSVVNRRHEPFDVYIGRGSPLGNPYTHLKGKTKAEFIVGTRDESIDAYEAYLIERPDLMALLPALRGKTLGCYCKPKRCHGDVLVRLLDQFSDLFLSTWDPNLWWLYQSCDKVTDQLHLWEPDGRI